MLVRKLALAVVIAIIIALYFVAGGEKYLSIRLYQDLFEQSPIATASVFFIVFLVGTSCSLPVAGVLSVVSGVVFGALPGFFISLLAVTLGGTVALYSTRYLFYALVKRRFTGQIEVVNKGIEKEGAFFPVQSENDTDYPVLVIESPDGSYLNAGIRIYAGDLIRNGASGTDPGLYR